MKKKNLETRPRSCPLWITEDPQQAEELKLTEGRCPLPALIMKMQIQGSCVGASAKAGKIIEVQCCEFYRRNKHMVDNSDGWVLGAGVTTDYLDCPFFSEWWWKHSGIPKKQ